MVVYCSPKKQIIVFIGFNIRGMGNGDKEDKGDKGDKEDKEDKGDKGDKGIRGQGDKGIFLTLDF